MDGTKISVFLLVLLTVIGTYQCGRFGGSRSSGGGYSRPSTYHRPAPAPSYHRPAATYRTPSYIRPSPPRPRATSRPSPPAYQPARASTSRPVYQTSRPLHQAARPVHMTTSRTIRGTTARPNYAQRTTPRRFNTARTTAASWNNIPPRPGHLPQGPANTYQTGSSPQKIKIVNKYNYHYPGYYSMPVSHGHYPGYFYTPSYYHYSTHDTGSTALGFYLGYSLARLSTPTYSHYSFYDGYRPRYDHYTVHHYYHNSEQVPKQQEIKPNTIIGCVGDTVSICPANTTSLCTSNGALMCVASATSTVPCSDNQQVNCVKSTISCVNNTAPECKNANQNMTSISIPCVSNAQVYGELKYVNNTIIVDTPANATTSTMTPTTSTNYPITTTPTPPPLTRRKRETAQNFCVTIVALPAEKKSTEGEETFNDAKFIVNKFFESAWSV